jgi:hypothetical protein
MPPTRTPAIHGWEDVSERPIVILGDAMLDRFLYGSAERLSPRRPCRWCASAERRAMAGGAGNVARNVSALGGVPRLVALAGDDADGAELAALLGEARGCCACPGRRTTTKLRVIAARQQVVRVDEEERRPAGASRRRRCSPRWRRRCPRRRPGAGRLRQGRADAGAVPRCHHRRPRRRRGPVSWIPRAATSPATPGPRCSPPTWAN